MSELRSLILTVRFVAVRCGRAMALLLTLGVGGSALGASAPEGSLDLMVSGVVAPRTDGPIGNRPGVTKPVVVVLENRGAAPEVIPDLATLRTLVDLQITSQGGDANPQAILVPPRTLPITLRPHQKLSIVYKVTFSRADLLANPGGFHFAAVLRPDLALPASDAVASPSTPTPPSIATSQGSPRTRAIAIHPLGDVDGASIKASAMRVILKKDATQSDPITFTAKWDRSFFVSEWGETPSDPVADPLLSDANNAKTVKVTWQNPGDYTVDAYLIHVNGDHSLDQVDPSTDVHVIKVELMGPNGDVDGMKFGITTDPSKPRSKMLTAKVTPASQMNAVKVKISKGNDKLNIKGDPTYDSGTITFEVEGIGKTGSKAEGDCTIEADVDGKPAAMANVTVIIPKTIISAPSNNQMVIDNSAVDAHSKSPDDFVPEGSVRLETLYTIHVFVTVGNQFFDPLVTPDFPDYQDADVSENVRSTTNGKLAKLYNAIGSINQTLQSNSTYDDPVSAVLPVLPGGEVILVPKNSQVAQDFVNLGFPAFDQSYDGLGDATVVQPVVDGFPLAAAMRRQVEFFSTPAPGHIELHQSIESP